MTDDKRGLFISFDEDGDVNLETFGDITNLEALWLLEMTKDGVLNGKFEEAEE